MEIISFGKATKAVNSIRELDHDIVARKAEDRFPTVKARLDWLENQADVATTESSFELDLSKGTFINTVLTNDHQVQLKEIEKDRFNILGSWESHAIDLGEGFLRTSLIHLEKQLPPSSEVEALISYSTNGISFSAYEPLDLDNPPQARYLKIKLNFTGGPTVEGDTASLLFNQEDIKLDLGEYAESQNEKVRLKTSYTKNMEVDPSWPEEGVLLRKTLRKEDYKKIYQVEVM